MGSAIICRMVFLSQGWSVSEEAGVVSTADILISHLGRNKEWLFRRGRDDPKVKPEVMVLPLPAQI